MGLGTVISYKLMGGPHDGRTIKVDSRLYDVMFPVREQPDYSLDAAPVLTPIKKHRYSLLGSKGVGRYEGVMD